MAACNWPRFTTTKSRRKMLLKPRLGIRMWSGIWPPSKPLIWTPVRAVWPLPPRPPVLPLPEPMPRPIRRRDLRAPGLSESWLSLILDYLVMAGAAYKAASVGCFDPHQVAYLVDHAADRGRILELAASPHPV